MSNKMLFYRIGNSVTADPLLLNLRPGNYGPFADHAALDADVISRRVEKDSHILVFEAELWSPVQDPREKPESEKRAPGNEANWYQEPRGEGTTGGTWRCKECHAVILDATIAHPIHDGPFPGSGSGECSYEHVGYCPNCERKPGYHGTPITPERR